MLSKHKEEDVAKVIYLKTEKKSGQPTLQVKLKINDAAVDLINEEHTLNNNQH